MLAISVALLSALVALGAICGQEADDAVTVTVDATPAPPSGASAKLRIDVLQEVVRCGDTVEAVVWLDDLPPGVPSLEGRSSGTPGVSGFQFGVQFDRDVLVASREGIALDEGIRALGWDLGSGGVVQYESVAFVVGVNFFPDKSSRGPNGEIPDDGLAVKRPPLELTGRSSGIPLARVIFEAAGAGSTAVAFAESPLAIAPSLINDGSLSYTPLELVSDEVRVDGDCIAPPTATASPGPTTPTPLPTLGLHTPAPGSGPPYGLPTVGRSCPWKQETGIGSGERYSYWRNDCLTGMYYLDAETGLVGRAGGLPAPPYIDCSRPSGDMATVCARGEETLREIHATYAAGVTLTAVAIATPEAP